MEEFKSPYSSTFMGLQIYLEVVLGDEVGKRKNE